MRTFLIRTAIAATLAAGLSGAALAQGDLGLVAGADRARDSEEQIADRVVTRGSSLGGLSFEDYVASYVGEIAKPISSDFGIARWDGRVCFGVMNIEAEAAQYVVNRISDVAAEVGLKIGRAGCAPDVFIIFTEDGRATSSALVDQQPLLFRPYGGAGGTTQDLHALEDFKTSDAAVRWWQTTMPVDYSGNIAVAVPGSPNAASASNPFGGIPTTKGSNSFISNGTRDQIQRAIVIVDASQLVNVNWTQLSDYLAVVTLAQIDPKAETGGFDTILNLFDGSAPSRMTDWDLSFLRALYRFDQHRMPRTQASLLASEMTRDQLRGVDE